MTTLDQFKEALEVITSELAKNGRDDDLIASKMYLEGKLKKGGIFMRNGKPAEDIEKPIGLSGVCENYEFCQRLNCNTTGGSCALKRQATATRIERVGEKMKLIA